MRFNCALIIILCSAAILAITDSVAMKLVGTSMIFLCAADPYLTDKSRKRSQTGTKRQKR